MIGRRPSAFAPIAHHLVIGLWLPVATTQEVLDEAGEVPDVTRLNWMAMLRCAGRCELNVPHDRGIRIFESPNHALPPIVEVTVATVGVDLVHDVAIERAAIDDPVHRRNLARDRVAIVLRQRVVAEDGVDRLLSPSDGGSVTFIPVLFIEQRLVHLGCDRAGSRGLRCIPSWKRLTRNSRVIARGSLVLILQANQVPKLVWDRTRCSAVA